VNHWDPDLQLRAASLSATHKCTNVHYLDHKGPVPVLNMINQANTIKSYFFNIHVDIFVPTLTIPDIAHRKTKMIRTKYKAIPVTGFESP
jgi:hypothetical protein